MQEVARRLHADRNGQTLVFLVLAAVLLLAFVVMVVATGQRVLGRQELQDAADAGAFGAAVMHAKALNLLALTNLLMAALLAVVIALTLVADVLAIVAGVLSGICASSWLTGQVWACGLVPTAWELQRDFSSLRDRVRPQLLRAARALPPFQDAVRDLAPAWAAAEAVMVARANVGDAGAAVLPLPTTRLPIERGSFDDLCDHALGMVVEPIRRLPPGAIFSRVAGWVEEMLDGFRSHYCGNGAGRRRRIRYEKGIPSHPTDPPTPGAGCHDCRKHEDVKRYYLTRVDETWEVVHRPGAPTITTAPQRSAPQHVRATFLPCDPRCGQTPHCRQERVERVPRPGALVERHRVTEWMLDACVVTETRIVDGGEPPPRDLLPAALESGWTRRGLNQTRAFVREGRESASRRLSLDAWRAGAPGNARRALAIAQAEFWSPSGDGLWVMDWRARLRRFRLPRGTPLPPGVDLPARELLQEFLLH